MWDRDFYESLEASLPAQIYPNIFKYSLHYPVVPIIFIISQITALHFLMMVQQRHIIGWVIPVVLVAMYYRHLYHYSFNGDLNPGKVVSVKPLRLAVAADLSIGEKEYKVVKIISPNIKYCGSRRLKVGDRVPTIALYCHPQAKEYRWGDLTPKPVQCFTFNRFKIEEAKNRIDQHLWDELDNAIRSMPAQIQTHGLYRID